MLALDAMIEECSVPNVPAWIVEGIIKIESSKKQFALNVNYPKKNKISYVPQHGNLVNATKQANSYINKGMTVSVGLMQVSSQNFSIFNLKLVDAFDACKNIKAGTAIFKEAWKITSVKYKNKQVALDRALSLYNSGSETIGLPYARRFRVATNTNLKKANPITLTQNTLEMLSKPSVEDNKVYLKIEPQVPTGLNENINQVAKREQLIRQKRIAEIERQRHLGITSNPFSHGTRIMVVKNTQTKKDNTIPFTNATTRIDINSLNKKKEDLSIEGATVAFDPYEAEHMGAFEERAISDADY